MKSHGCTIYEGDVAVATCYCEGHRELYEDVVEGIKLPCSPSDHGDGVEQAWKLADLFAASPEMLEALILAERQLRDSHDGKRADDENILNTLSVVQAAIRKAGGSYE